MKRNGSLLSIGLLCLLCWCVPYRAEAQFLKKLFGKKEPPPRRTQPAAAKPGTKAATPPKKVTRKTRTEQLSYPRSELKSRYRVDVLVPLYLNELVKNGKAVSPDQIPDKAVPGITFYEGIQLAADTLNKTGYHLDIHVHDIADPQTSVDALIRNKRLDSSDLIIGAVQAYQVGPIAQFAKKRQVNFVSALSPSDANVKDNPYFTLLQPTLQTHCDWLRKAISDRQGSAPVLVYHRSAVAADQLAFAHLTADGSFKFTDINVTALPKVPYLRALLDSMKVNIIAMPIVDAGYARQLLQQLNTEFPNHRFEIYGMPSWQGMSLLRKTDALENIAVYLTDAFYYNPTTEGGQHVAAQYHRVFGGKPAELVYRGYETLSWYAYLLNRYGNVFNGNLSDNNAAAFTRFDIRPRWDKDDNLLYNENGHLYLFRYQGGSFSLEQ